MMHVTLAVRLTLAGPVLTKSSTSGRPGIDAPMARSRGRFYLPYSLVRGRLRQSWEELDGAGIAGLDVDDWLGPRDLKGSFNPQRGRLRLSDFFHSSNLADAVGVRTRIRMDHERHAADDGALQFLESPFAPGETATFEGEIDYFARDAAEGIRIADAVRDGLRWSASFGGGRTFGFGRLVELSVSIATSHDVLPAHTVAGPRVGAERLGLVLKPRSPFCVSQYGPVDNLFQGDAVIPGAVIRGAIAEMLKAIAGKEPRDAVDLGTDDDLKRGPWKELAECFDQVRITHAFPSLGGAVATRRRPVKPPLSLVKAKFAGKEDWRDVALCEHPTLLGDPPRAPAFEADWKAHEDVLGHFGWPDLTPHRELRVRTAIDPEYGRAEEAKLFAYEMVVPDDGLAWLAHLDLSRIADPSRRAAVEQQIRSLLKYGLPGVSKTKAMTDVTFEEDKHVQPYQGSCFKPVNGYHIVTLQSPFLLTDPQLFDEASGHSDLLREYRKSWCDLSGGTLDLRWFFARQRLAGGYLTKRFQGGKPYNPFLLTEAGSVFVFQVTPGQDARARAKLQDWQEHGLSLPSWAVSLYGDSWQTCPFRAVDGFGEVAINLDCHHQRACPGARPHQGGQP